MAASRTWRAEMKDVCRVLTKLRERVEKLAEEMDDGPTGPPFDPP